MKRFYLGVHRVHWLAEAGVPVFISHRLLAPRKTLPKAAAPWGLDSGGFTELSMYGKWMTRPSVYVKAVRRYRDEIGKLEFAAPQDWMCEPVMLAKTGLTVDEHLRRTVNNYLLLKMLGPELPFIPVLQGWEPADYLRCAAMYEAEGVELAKEPLVGIGTVCRRQDTEGGRAVLAELEPLGLSLHGFGVKQNGLRVFGHSLTTSDSMAWSYDARWDARRESGRRYEVTCGKKTCANCLHYALAWRKRALATLGPWAPPLDG